jgi:hypothetical protein
MRKIVTHLINKATGYGLDDRYFISVIAIYMCVCVCVCLRHQILTSSGIHFNSYSLLIDAFSSRRMRWEHETDHALMLKHKYTVSTLGSTQPPIQWVPGALSSGVKRPRREADHSPPANVLVKKICIYTSTPSHAFTAPCLIRWAQWQLQLYSIHSMNEDTSLMVSDVDPYRMIRSCSFLS